MFEYMPVWLLCVVIYTIIIFVILCSQSSKFYHTLDSILKAGTICSPLRMLENCCAELLIELLGASVLLMYGGVRPVEAGYKLTYAS